MGNTICRIKVIRNFKDLQLDKSVKMGDVYEVTKKRAEELVALKFVQVLEVYTPEKVEEPVTETQEEVKVEEPAVEAEAPVSKSQAKRIAVTKRGGKRTSKRK